MRNLSLRLGVFIFVILFFNSLASSLNLAYAQSCTQPEQVKNVAITFPNCVGEDCNFTQGKCSWNAVTGATGYKVIVTAYGTNTQVLNQQTASSTTSLAFPVATSDTYKCDVSAINACGTGAVGTSSLLCKTDLMGATPGVTAVPTQVTTQASPVPTMGPAGSNTTVLLGFAGFAMIIISLTSLLLIL